MSKVTVSATALGYNHPRYGRFGVDLGPRTLKRLTAALQERFPEACVIACGIGCRERDYPGDAGNVSWDATFVTEGVCTQEQADSIGEEIAGLLFGQYGLGDSGDLDECDIEQEQAAAS